MPGGSWSAISSHAWPGEGDCGPATAPSTSMCASSGSSWSRPLPGGGSSIPTWVSATGWRLSGRCFQIPYAVTDPISTEFDPDINRGDDIDHTSHQWRCGRDRRRDRSGRLWLVDHDRHQVLRLSPLDRL